MIARSAQKAKKPQKLNRNKILNTPAREIVFDAVLQGMNLKKAAQKANLGHNYVKKWVSTSNFYPLVKQEQAKIARNTAKKLHITAETQIKRLRRLGNLGRREKQIAAAVAAEREVGKLLGLYEEDNRQKSERTLLVLGSPKAIDSKVLDSGDNTKSIQSTPVKRLTDRKP